MTVEERLTSTKQKLSLLGIPTEQSNNWILLEQYNRGEEQVVINCSVPNGRIDKRYNHRIDVSDHMAACEYIEGGRKHVVDILCYGIEGIVASFDLTNGVGLAKTLTLDGHELFILKVINPYSTDKYTTTKYTIVSTEGNILSFIWAGKEMAKLEIENGICRMSSGLINHLMFDIKKLNIRWKSNTTWLNILEQKGS